MFLDDSPSLSIFALGEKGSHEIICGIANISILPQTVFKYALSFFEFPLFMEIDIYLDDLKPEVQKRVLRELGLKSAKDGNYDVFPLLTLVSAQTGQDE